MEVITLCKYDVEIYPAEPRPIFVETNAIFNNGVETYPNDPRPDKVDVKKLGELIYPEDPKPFTVEISVGVLKYPADPRPIILLTRETELK